MVLALAPTILIWDVLCYQIPAPDGAKRVSNPGSVIKKLNAHDWCCRPWQALFSVQRSTCTPGGRTSPSHTTRTNWPSQNRTIPLACYPWLGSSTHHAVVYMNRTIPLACYPWLGSSTHHAVVYMNRTIPLACYPWLGSSTHHAVVYMNRTWRSSQYHAVYMEKRGLDPKWCFCVQVPLHAAVVQLIPSLGPRHA